MKRERPVAILGLDGADHVLIERWSTQGHLPAFAKLLREGTYGLIDSTAAILSGTPWLSIASGCNPAKCGVYHRHQIRSGTYEIRRIKARDVRQPPFWSSFRGPIVAVDVPKLPLCPSLDGIQLVEWGAYDHYAKLSSVPDGFSADVLTEFGGHPFVNGDFEEKLHERRDFEFLKDQMLDGVRMKHRLNVSLLRKYRPRLLVSVFGETHAAGHAFWRFQDPRHPLFVHGGRELFLKDIYQAIDAVIAEFIEALPNDYILIVVSGHGFDLDSMAGDLLQEVLTRMGMTVPKQANARYAAYVPALSLDMTQSRAFCLPTDWQGLIRINLREREPDGIVSRAEYQAVCDEIETELLALRHRHNDAPVVKAVVRLRHLYRGAFSDELPDLSVIWDTGSIVSEVGSRRSGLIERHPDLSGGCGNHRGSGFVLAYGPGVGSGRLTGCDFDIAPTISDWLGERALPEWDGLPLKLMDSKSRLIEDGM
jgi:predicted AlkP superfamily phosphohydrolase/phosphomutase